MSPPGTEEMSEYYADRDEEDVDHESDTSKHQEGEPGKARHRYLALEFAYYLRSYSFTSDSQGTYQSFFFGEHERFGFQIETNYLRQFSSNAFPIGIGGYYYLASNVRAGLNLQFAPTSTVVARQTYNPFFEFGLLGKRVVPRIEYRFQEYKQADMHEVRVGIDLHPASWITIRPFYQWSLTQIGGGGGNFRNSAGLIKVSIHPIQMLELYGLYAYSQHNFEAGSPTAFAAYTAQDGGGGFQIKIGQSALFFDFIYESRNNGTSVQAYQFGTLVTF